MSSQSKIDAELLTFLHDLPDGATEAIQKVVATAASQSAKKANKSGWVRLGIQSVILGGVVGGALSKFGNVATKEDIRILERQYADVLTSRSSQDETQNNRIATLERRCDDAYTCCQHQTTRIDLITAPRSR